MSAIGVGYDAVIDSPDRLSEYYRDDSWLKAYPLNLVTVLDYFAFSPFYDRNSINERVKQRSLDASRANMEVGVEYTVSATADPNLFIIERLHRKSPTETVALSVYYCVHGTIYQSPDLASLLNARIERASHFVGKAIKHTETLREAMAVETGSKT